MRLLNTADTAQLLGVTERTVRRLLRAGNLKAHSQGPGRGRHAVYSPESVREEQARRGLRA